MERAAGEPLAFVLLCGFHHTRGNHVESCVPPLASLPPEWDALPFVALPDGAHKSAADFVFFLAPSSLHGLLFGVSCYRQVAASEKFRQANKEVTRSSIQKAVVALCRYPLFGLLRDVMGAATQAYFNQEDFSDQQILSGVFQNVNVSLRRLDVRKEFSSYLHMGVDARQLILRYGRNALVLFKAFLAGKKVILFNDSPIVQVCNEVLSLISLLPGALTHFSSALLEAAGKPIPLPDQAHDNAVTPDLDWSRLGMPMLPFSNSDVVSGHWSQLPGRRAQKSFLFFPFAGLHSLDEMKTADGYLAAVSNQLFLNLPPDQANVVVLATGEVKVRPGHERVCELTPQDKRFIASVVDTCQLNSGDGQYVGSDGWVREAFKEYLAGLLSTIGHVEGVFDTQPRTIKLPSEALEYGAAFIGEFMQTGCFARWTHSVDQMYVMIGDVVLHPSGPPCDALDHFTDGASELQQDIAEAAQKAKKKLSQFWQTHGPSSRSSLVAEEQHVISDPVNDPETAAHDRAEFKEEVVKKQPDGDVMDRFKSWWNSDSSKK